jgi:hypothetical protein
MKIYPISYNLNKYELFSIFSNDDYIIHLPINDYKNFGLCTQLIKNKNIIKFDFPAKVIYITHLYIQDLLNGCEIIGFCLKFQDFFDCMDNFGIDDDLKFKWMESIFDKYRKGWKDFMYINIYKPSLKINNHFKFYSHMRIYLQILDIIPKFENQISTKPVLFFTISFILGVFIGFRIKN